MADPRSPGGSVADNLREPGTSLHVLRTRSRRARHPSKPRRQPQKADQAENDKERPPAETGHQTPAEKNAQRRSQRLTCSDNGIRDASLAFREMVGEDLGVGGVRQDSPIPRTTRIASKATKAWRTPVNAVAADQTKKPTAKTHFTSKRSTSQPARSCMQA